jgi:hypothetical protein
MSDRRFVVTVTVNRALIGRIDPQTGQRVNLEGKPEPHEHHFIPWGSDARFERCRCGATRRADAGSATAGEPNPNPCVQRWGRGPAGALCRDCAHLTVYEQSRKWYKCGLRTDLTHGAKTDHRVKWDACSRYEARAPEPAKDAQESPPQTVVVP